MANDVYADFLLEKTATGHYMIRSQSLHEYTSLDEVLATFVDLISDVYNDIVRHPEFISGTLVCVIRHSVRWYS